MRLELGSFPFRWSRWSASIFTRFIYLGSSDSQPLGHKLCNSRWYGDRYLSCYRNWLSIFLGSKGNEMIAKNYLKYGWKFVNPEYDIVKIAKEQWGIKTEIQP